MAEKTCWETFKAESAAMPARLKALIHTGNIRRVLVEHKGKVVAEFPLTAGVVGIVVAPILAAIGALVALLEDCTIRVETVAGPSTVQAEAPQPQSQV